MTDKTAIARLRAYLESEGLYAMVIPSGDCHFGEYTQEHFRIIPQLCGFTGSAGTLAVTCGNAALWTDSRYFGQAEKQMRNTGVELMRMKMAGTPSIGAWIASGAPSGAVIAVDGSLFSAGEIDRLRLEAGQSVSLREIRDPFDEILPERKPVHFNPVFEIRNSVAGEARILKRGRLMADLHERLNRGTDIRLHYFTQLCDEVAWLSNLRGSDIECNPVFMSYAVVEEDRTVVFASVDSVDPELVSCLRCEGVYIHPYDEIRDYLEGLDEEGNAVVAASLKISSDFSRMFKAYRKAEFIDDPSAWGSVSMMKAVKNKVEIEGFRKANRMDAVAWIKFLKFIDDHYRDGGLDEYALSQKLISIRRELYPDQYVTESFAPIVAFGKNAALAHYQAAETSSARISGDGFLLIDTGAQYRCGTTDVTRTLPLGTMTSEQKMDYALILKGMTDLSMAVFMEGATGHSLDILARGPICTEHKIYMHGTGHGIGHFLNVHEGPQSIRMEHNPVPMMPGMVTSVEPAVYVTDRYGIRIENSILCRKAEENEYGSFLDFETINLVPIETAFVAEELREICAPKELRRISDYNGRIYEIIGPSLSPEEREWFISRYLK